MTRTLFRPLGLAWHFLTVIKLSRTVHDATPAELARSMGWYPLIGLCLGIVLAIADRGLSLWLDSAVVDVLLVVVLVALTGGLHQDGLADTLDGIAGGKTAADRLRIMKDPHIGAIGVTGLVLDMALRIAGLQALPDEMRSPVLICVPMFGRWGIVVGSWGARYARAEGGVAAPFLAELSWRDVGLATVLALPIALLQVGWVPVLACSGAAILLAWMMTRSIERLCGGITGDVLGAVNEVVEISVLLLLPIGAGYS